VNIRFARYGAAIALCALPPAIAWAATEGSSVTLFGLGAGTGSPDTGSLGDTFIGEYAGYYNIAGVRNTFLGERAGSNSTTDDNTFLGYRAGYNSADGSSNTFVGSSAGLNNTSGVRNTFMGDHAGWDTGGSYNTFLGYYAGNANLLGNGNVALGDYAGYSAMGSRNVFLGNEAGFFETGSDRLYIDNCASGGSCNPPFIYGEFDNHLLKINGVTSVAANGVAKSQMHFSLDNGDYGGFLTSVLPNNFFVSSGARYDSGNWVQRSADGNAVMAGSGGQGYRIFTHTGTAVGNTFTNPTLRLHIDYSGQFGINTAPVAGDEIHTSSGAHLTAGGVWTDASSRSYKEHIETLTARDADQALAALQPVTFNYKVDTQERHVGFIAEDVPDLVATKDRTSLAPMDIVAVLTKVVQEQKQTIAGQKEELAHAQQQLSALASRIVRLEAGAASGRN
jgi:hypothetical protein